MSGFSFISFARRLRPRALVPLAVAASALAAPALSRPIAESGVPASPATSSVTIAQAAPPGTGSDLPPASEAAPTPGLSSPANATNPNPAGSRPPANGAGAIVTPPPVAYEAAPPTGAAGEAAPIGEAQALAEAGSAASALEGRDATLPHDLSPLGMFRAADIVVKAVMVGLAAASVLTWAVWFVKSLEVAVARRRARRALQALTGARSLDQAWRALKDGGDCGAEIVRAAVGEAELSAEALPHVGGDGLKERVVSRLARIEAAAARRMARGTGLLATIGATAPFVGLFGTVWGIMNAFIGISEAQTTNLAVVAPGIAEALLATALGLVAAIPAVVIYNHFARALAGYRLQLGDMAAATLRLISRDIDLGTLPPGRAAVPDDPRRAGTPVPRAAE